MDLSLAMARGTVALLVAGTVLPCHLSAQDERPRGWSDVAEVTFVLTSGNASASTFGFKNTAEHLWDNASFKLSFGAVRTETGKTTRTATGTPEDFTITKETKREVTAERLFVKTRLDRSLGEVAFIYAGADWDRNTFAGIQNRYGLVSGAGHTWYDGGGRRLKADLGFTYTFQDDVVKAPGSKEGFVGLRGSYDYLRKITRTTELGSVLILDQSLNTSEDFRADWTNSLAVSMSERLALKTSLQILFDRSPSLTSVPLGDGEVFTPLGKVDSVFTVAIVANF